MTSTWHPVRRLAAAAVTGTLLTLAAAPTAHTAPAPTQPEPATASTRTLPGHVPTLAPAATSAATALSRLKVANERRTGYDRDLFPHWVSTGAGCDARDTVLRRDATRKPTVRPGCVLTGGRWVSKYDGVKTTNPSTFDVDHVVPLAETWDSGAYRWTTASRQAYANDTRGPTLLAVSASSNRSKGDQDPAEWLPPRIKYRCAYVARWIAVKTKWRLSVDRTEKAALQTVLAGCGRITLPPLGPRPTITTRAVDSAL